jgi:hypothetical protein
MWHSDRVSAKPEFDSFVERLSLCLRAALMTGSANSVPKQVRLRMFNIPTMVIWNPFCSNFWERSTRKSNASGCWPRKSCCHPPTQKKKLRKRTVEQDSADSK